MPAWMTAPQIVERYLVSEARLLEFSSRGNLPFERRDGECFFDERVVASFFRSRLPSIVSHPVPAGPFLGLLGIVRLGDADSQTHVRYPNPARDPRRQPAPSVIPLPASPFRRTGTHDADLRPAPLPPLTPPRPEACALEASPTLGGANTTRARARTKRPPASGA